jgi:hypothetical protein
MAATPFTGEYLLRKGPAREPARRLSECRDENGLDGAGGFGLAEDDAGRRFQDATGDFDAGGHAGVSVISRPAVVLGPWHAGTQCMNFGLFWG